MMDAQHAQGRRKCRDAAYRLLSRRDHSERELQKKLGRRFGPEVVEAVIESLRAQNLVNDRRFALSYARQLVKKAPCGERLIRRKLDQRGIAPTIIEETLTELDIDEEEQAEAAVELKLPSLLGCDRETAARRLLSHLERRGFTAPVARGLTLRVLQDWPYK